MKILVTGGCGFIGSHLVDRLIELKHPADEVVVLDNLSTGTLENLNPKAKLLKEINWNDYYHVIYHLAAQASIPNSFKNPCGTIDTNVILTTEICELARQSKAKLIYAGSSSFYGDPRLNAYSLSKWLGEEVCLMFNKVYSVPVSVARFFNVYGPRQKRDAGVIAIFEELRKKNLPLTPTGTGEQRRDFIYVGDIAEGLIKMAETDCIGEIFNLGCEENFSINEVAKMFKPISIEHIPARPGEMQETLADTSLTKEKLNWHPQVKLKDYIEKFLNENFL